MENIGQLIKQMSNLLINDLNRKLKKYDITFSQLQVLLAISESNEKLSQKDIATTLRIKHTSLIDILKILERKKLVKKKINNHDTKCNEIELTSNAKDILKHLDFGKDETQEMLAMTLGYSTVDEMLSKFKDALKKLEEGK